MNARGTTPTDVFTVDIDLRDAEVVYLNYRQGSTRLEKVKSDLDIYPDRVEVHLTQEETLKFKPREVEAQFRARYPDGNAVISNIIIMNVGDAIKGGVI